MKIRSPKLAAIVVSCSLFFPGLVDATEWPSDPTENLPICTIPFSHESPQIVSDGANGAIITWSDLRASSIWIDIYAQRVSATGNLLWTIDGIPICSGPETQQYPAIASDGAGGAIIAWRDNRNGVDWDDWDVYAQRVDSFGNVMWDSDGVAICTAVNDQYQVRIASDGASGAIVAWTDFRADSGTPDIYAQRVDASGNVLWGVDGVPISTAAYRQDEPQIVSDGWGGAIIVWRSGSDIYAQRVNGSGAALWTHDGVPLCTAYGYQGSPQIISDDMGGAIATWTDGRAGAGEDIYAQRVDANGNILWNTNGVAVCAAVGSQIGPQVLADGSSGAFICWSDDRYDGADVWANRISGDGNILWMTDGVPVGVALYVQGGPHIASDGQGGAIIAWADARNERFSHDIYAQRMDPDGNALWAANGVAISTAANEQHVHQLVSDGLGGAIITWEDWREGGLEGHYHVYAQRVDSTGALAVPTGIDGERPRTSRILTLFPPVPTPSGSQTELRFELSVSSDVTIEIFDIRGRRIRAERLGSMPQGTSTYLFDGRDEKGRLLASGVYLAKVMAGRTTQVQKVVVTR